MSAAPAGRAESNDWPTHKLDLLDSRRQSGLNGSMSRFQAAADPAPRGAARRATAASKPQCFPTMQVNLVRQQTNVLLAANVRSASQKIVIAGSIDEPASNEARPGSGVTVRRIEMGRGGLCPNVSRALRFTRGDCQNRYDLRPRLHRTRRSFIPYICRCALTEGRQAEISSGTRLVDWLYVADLAEALVRLGQKADRRMRRHVDLGTGDNDDPGGGCGNDLRTGRGLRRTIS